MGALCSCMRRQNRKEEENEIGDEISNFEVTKVSLIDQTSVTTHKGVSNNDQEEDESASTNACDSLLNTQATSEDNEDCCIKKLNKEEDANSIGDRTVILEDSKVFFLDQSLILTYKGCGVSNSNQEEDASVSTGSLDFLMETEATFEDDEVSDSTVTKPTIDLTSVRPGTIIVTRLQPDKKSHHGSPYSKVTTTLYDLGPGKIFKFWIHIDKF
ncbi:uncharacterized protein LOC124159420 [Ischnura elegans]|uniref:uncharacterized protein LOC124159420 n=1 Tax=Ischnura elegans TaxID=197161 RepID=UPI001ED89595|nr:uncharacterized protein LOC124159420 [Ischnura elegans]